MSSTHAAIYFHIIFGTKNRIPCIAADWEDRLHAYLGGVIREKSGKALAIGGFGDHVHLAVSLKPMHFLPDLMRDLKRHSSRWIHETIGLRSFDWQDGYGVFTVSFSNVEEVVKYVLHQRGHHQTRTFREEYVAFLKAHMVEYRDEYV